MRSLTRRTARNAGFTLMELVVVMTIIAILAGAVMIQVNKNIKHARRARALQDIKTIETALGIYEAHNGFPPLSSRAWRRSLPSLPGARNRRTGKARI